MAKLENKIFNILFRKAAKLLKDYPIELVAGTLMAIAIRFYRTSLNDEEFERMMQVVANTNPEPYDSLKKQTIH